MGEVAAVATVAGTMVGRMGPKLADFLLKNQKLRADLVHDIEHIKRESNIISATIKQDNIDRPPWSGNEPHKQWINMVRDLACAIDDCIDSFIHRMPLKTGVSWPRRKYHRVKTRKVRNKFAKAIRDLRKTSNDIFELRRKYTDKELYGGGGGGGGGGSNTLDPDAPDEEMETDEETEADTALSTASLHVGLKAARDEVMEMISETAQGQQAKELKVKVISIVGFGGIGKTLLARQAYDTIKNQYQACAWVCASDKRAKAVLTEILRKLEKHPTVGNSGGSAGSSCTMNKLRATIRRFLQTKRFIIVIDDMREDFWEVVKDAFPVVPGDSNRVIITTATQTIANECSSANGHVYVMRTLDEDHSKQLLMEIASLDQCPPLASETELCSEALKKCDGLPLALVTTGKLLHGDRTRERWAILCKTLGVHLENNKKLASMKHVLTRSYTSLGSQDVKNCLLYLGIFPVGRPVRRGSLIRRWSAEGFIPAESAAIGNFDELVDRSIIQPIDASSSNITKVKTCQTHGMMLEFIMHKSMCQNFVTVLYDNATLSGDVRWLSLHGASSKMDQENLHLVRSLTIFGKAHKSVLDFSKYRLMRVLDLEGCNEHLEDEHLKAICSNLFLLRYLSLRGAATVKVLPKEIRKLQVLETLDLRGTNIEIMPTQVMQLPSLLHLFGKFKLPQGVGGRKMHKLHAWLEENSKLQTVAGFVVDNKSQRFAQVMNHMKVLTKVKIWCESTADANSSSHVSKGIKTFMRRGTDSSDNSSHLSEAIKDFVERGADSNTSLSLSMNFNHEWPQDLQNFSLKKDTTYYLRSLKLQGNNICSQLPQFVTMLRGVTKLCLQFPRHQLSADILVSLGSVRGLKYLKLIATQLDMLVIGHDILRNMRHLCVVVEVMTGMVIEEGALPCLESLQLLCKDLNCFSGTKIQSLPCLKEVALHDGVCKETKQEWEGATKNHPRRPRLLFFTKKMVDDHFMGSEAAVEISHAATTTDTTAVESEPAQNSESHDAPPTDTTLMVTTSPDVISTRESVQVATTSEMVGAQDLMGTDSATESSSVATSTDTTKKIDVESEPSENCESPVAPPTDMMLSMTTAGNVISTEESVRLNGGCQHGDDGKDVDNIEDPKDFATKDGRITQVIDQMNNESFKEEMEGVADVEDQQMDNGTQGLRARLLSLVKIGIFQ
ncbi:hypothetical protein CFC21_105252 [Triticum aestivum]|uniref:NB-ARC domain-containing protein n=2 Tax=Triticum aestivum TaxID=4565 RepID=A0A9R1N8D1_WHEAT|nr:disease resistance protein RGA4-like [Triticum aestivum]KAF7104350.1 hypothetical protein CFC21_105252 [Triticum aestivum]